MFGAGAFGASEFGGAVQPGAPGGDVVRPVSTVSWEERVTSWVVSRYRDRPRFMGLMLTIAREAQRIEDAVTALRESRYLDTAYGAQLDEVGRRFGWPRAAGLHDSAYRVEILARARAAASSGTSADLIAVFQILGQGVHRFRLTEGPSEVVVDLLTQVQPGEGQRWAKIGRAVVPAATRYFLRYQVAGASPFLWSDDPLYDGVVFPESEGGATVALAEADEGR